MPDISELITDNLDIWSSTLKKKKAVGRGTSKKIELYGVKKLRELILDLAVRGLLVPQNPNSEVVDELFKKIETAKAYLISNKKIKKQKPLPAITSEELPFRLPNTWKWMRLGEVTNYGTSDKVNPKDVTINTWVLELEDVEKTSSRLLAKVRFNERNFKSSKNVFSNGDVIYGKLRPYLDKVIVADEDGVCTTEMIPVKAHACITSKFLRIVMKSPYFISYANESTHGMNLPRMGTVKARMALIPLLSEEEQNRIVAKVDELMTLCDQLEQQQEDSISAHQTLVKTLLDALVDSANHSKTTEGKTQFEQAWERIAEHFDTLFTTEDSIDQLKQTILQLAVMGKLVPQDPSDEPAIDLLKKLETAKTNLIESGFLKKQKAAPQITNKEKPYLVPDNWLWVRLSDAFDVRDGTHDSPKDALGEDTYPLITSKNFRDGLIDFDSARRISREDHVKISERSLVEPDDILFSMIGGNIGNQVMVTDPRQFSIKNVALFKYYDRDLTSPNYFKIYTEELALNLQNSASGGAQPFISLGALRKLLFPLPPIPEQIRIVSKTIELLGYCDQLKTNLETANLTQLKLADAITKNTLT